MLTSAVAGLRESVPETEVCLEGGEVERFPGQVAPAPGDRDGGPSATRAETRLSHHTCTCLVPIYLNPQPSFQRRIRLREATPYLGATPAVYRLP